MTAFRSSRLLSRQRRYCYHQGKLAGMQPPCVDSPLELAAHIATLQDDRKEMLLLMSRCDRPAVKARLSEFLLEMENELSRLRQDPLELDEEDRRELRLFHLHKMQLQARFVSHTAGIAGGVGVLAIRAVCQLGDTSCSS
eukprot:TRINITY_DN9710_c0_g2_i1.p1 TRINITY_DN9710_c0_g2~~TRINITY_DN9710_c0_g2_i1.p1  ORF type:complete len:140 (+),score=28.19 TRINITY_DN9710_c0_g2_i1:23-442(+)